MCREDLVFSIVNLEKIDRNTKRLDLFHKKSIEIRNGSIFFGKNRVKHETARSFL